MRAPHHILLDVRSTSAIRDTPSEIRLFSKCRNERLRLPAFLRHYRQIGVDRFFIVDNGSTDGSLEFLTEQPDVHTFSTNASFREAWGGTDWLNALLHRFGVGRWCVTVDIDEFLYYPGSDFSNLRRLVSHLDSRDEEAVSALLVDMYPGTALASVQYSDDNDPLESAPYFDSRTYKRFSYDQCPWFTAYGGVRERVFYPASYRNSRLRQYHIRLHHGFVLRIPVVNRLGFVRNHAPAPPCLTKVPLVRWADDTEYLNVNHFVSPRRVASVTSVLLHFKLLGDFQARAAVESERREYYAGAAEFRQYRRVLGDQPDAGLLCEDSVRFEGDEQLERLGLMSDSEEWRAARSETASP